MGFNVVLNNITAISILLMEEAGYDMEETTDLGRMQHDELKAWGS